MNTSTVRWPDSLWAAVTPSGPELPELTGTQQADVIVIGGGFTGLSTALHLREAGVDVAIVEAAEPGWGASGRNNGQVIPTLSRPDPEDIVAKHGESGERFVGMLRDSASYLFDVTRRYNIDAEGEQAGWVVKTAKREISGRALVMATNAYSGEFSKSLVPQIAHEVMPVLSWQMATQPLSDNVRKTIIPGRQAMSDTHGELYFARYDARNRLVTGGAVIGPGNKVERIKARVTERLQRLWPQIGEVSFDYVWNGYVGMTTDFLPRIHKLGPNAYGWTGCNGRAVALTIPLGNELAKAVRGVPENELALPFTEPVPIVGHGVLRKLAPLMLLVYRRRDAREMV